MILAKDRDQAMDAAGEIGFPVVLKACGASLMHKTEAGGVSPESKRRSRGSARLMTA
ncbi:MAG: acetate--CoA ligase family protein [Desulfobacterales bacterium]